MRSIVAAQIVLIAGILLPSLGSTAEIAADRKLWLQDYALLKAELERSYSHLAWFASPSGGVNVPIHDRRTQAALKHAGDVAEARLAIRNFVTGFHDGHFSELPALEASSAIASKEPSHRDLLKDDATSGCAALGYAERSQVGFSLPFESLPGFSLEADGTSTPFRAGVMLFNGKEIGIVRIKNFSQRQYPTECVRTWIDNPGIAKTDNAFQDLVNDAWFASLAKQLTRFKARGVHIVLVDIGNNSGGNDSGDWAARLFTARQMQSARLFIAASPIATAYLDEQIGELQSVRGVDPALESAASRSLEFFLSRKAGNKSRLCDMSWVWREQRAFAPQGCSRLLDVGFASGAFSSLEAAGFHDRRAAAKIHWPEAVGPWRGAWSGPTYLLTNGTTYSSAEMFAAVMKDNGVAKVVGTRTGGDGCGFMAETPPLVLPHLQLRFRLPNCVRLRADGTDEVAGIEPDIAVAAMESESPRSRAMRLLDKITADARP